MLARLEQFFQKHPRLAVRILERKSMTGMLTHIQRVKALRVVRQAADRVPAYRAFLEEHGWKAEDVRHIRWHDWEHLPIMDKASYVKAYPIEQRCLDGKLPTAGKIDESGGSTGTPTEWVHSIDEERRLLASVGIYRQFWWTTHTPIILINALSCGPWSGGITTTIILHTTMLVKTVGTDVQSVIRTLEQFGTRYTYIIAAYPLFITDLLETNFPWKDYHIDFLTGGDPHSLAWQARVEAKTGGRVISAYGNSDVDVGIAIETPLTQYIRRAAQKEVALREALSWYGDIPMIFQYDPFTFLIEEEGHELIMTHLDPVKTLPAIRYNMHDEGKVLSYEMMVRLIETYAPAYLSGFKKRHGKLPFLILDGRSDGTISLDGANVHPSEIEDIIFKEKQAHKFKLVRRERPPYFVILIELTRRAKPSRQLAQRLEKRILRELPQRNRDYAESLRANPHVAPHVMLIPYGSKAFRLEDRKYKWILREEHLKAYGIRI